MLGITNAKREGMHRPIDSNGKRSAFSADEESFEETALQRTIYLKFYISINYAQTYNYARREIFQNLGTSLAHTKKLA